jgi:hypothetical protein
MRRDFIFFIKGIDPNLYVKGTSFILLLASNELKNLFSQLENNHAGVGAWFKVSQEITVAVVRHVHEAFDESFDAAYKTIHGACDTYAVLADEVPVISPAVAVREADGNDAHISFIFDTAGRVTWNAPEGAAARWGDRNVEVVKKLLPCFDLATSTQKQTELSEQLELSLKMYRHGAAASTIGIEFLCKMSALEGLICGHERFKKERLLKERIALLIRDSTDWNTEVSELWKLRCAGSHRSDAFSPILGTAASLVDFIFVAVVVFVADHLKTVSAITDLWSLAGCYHLPPAAVQKREGNRGRSLRATMKPGLKWSGAGSIIDAHFKDLLDS